LNGVFKKFGKVDDKNEAINLLVKESLSAKSQIEDLSGGEDRVKELSKEVDREFKQTIDLAKKLSNSRIKAGVEASKEITKELSELALVGAEINIEIKSPDSILEKDLTTFGVDSVQFMFSSHKSAKMAPLSKSASGGELSRVMLAIEVVLSKSSAIGTFIFDEVDAGVGGKAAIEVGRKLASVSKSAQVVVVTHLPQVAVWANNHLMVEKSEKGDVIESSVFPVTGEARATEIARLLSGQEGSETAREHARELLELVGNSALR
jgi:DNA repair protein RecN (Recombination protein N)